MSSSLLLSELSESLLSRIVTFLHEDKNSVCSLCVTSKALSAVAARVLYAKISISSRSDIEFLRNFLVDQGDDRTQSALVSSCSARNVKYVHTFEVTGMLFFGAATNQTEGLILRSLEVILSQYTNLRTFSWRPTFCDTDLTKGVIGLLPHLVGLESLSIKVPFSATELPVAPSSKPARHLDVITEEDEEHQEEGGDVSARGSTESLDGVEDDEGENVAPYEYKPLEDDSDVIFKLKQNLPYPIPARELSHLQCLVLASCTPEVLVPLPDILQALVCPLRSLCFEDDCGSVTPGILSSMLPVSQGLERFGLGVAYSIKYDDFFPFLTGLPKLQRLELHHYTQLQRPTLPLPRLSTLKSLKITHTHTTTRKDVVNMCVWTRRIISSSPLEALEMVCEDSDECPTLGPGHGISHGGLIDHLVSRHRDTLRVLKIPGGYVGECAIKKLLGKEGEGCKMLEEIEFCARKQVYDALVTMLGTVPRLRAVRLTIVNIKRSTVLPIDKNMLREGRTSLRDVIVNGRGVEGEWTVETNSEEPLSAPKPVFRIWKVEEQRR